MDKAPHRARFDWLAEIAGASALALAIGFAGLKLAPSLGIGPPVVLLAAGIAFGLGALAMRAVPGEPPEHALPGFALATVDAGELLLDCPISELLLDAPFEEPLLLEDVLGDDELLLDDRLDEAGSGSRVVQLFASPPMPTPGQLRERIERHLATGAMHMVREYEGPAPDASDALYAALNELKRSLR